MEYYHVDVFSSEPLAGNGLTVVFPKETLDPEIMLKIAQEFKQFETIFIFPKKDNRYPVRIFTVEEELEFAGHPIIGAGAIIHYVFYNAKSKINVSLHAGNRTIDIKSEKKLENYQVEMNQGQAEFVYTLNSEQCTGIFNGLNLSIDHLHPNYPVEVVSTGLPYLLLPLKNSLDKVKIVGEDFEDVLAKVGAKFMYAFDPEELECRTWDNSGIVEDVATGSAAGPLCAYLVKNNYKVINEKIILKQGKYINRDSRIVGYVSENNQEVIINGEVSLFSKGEILKAIDK